MFFTCTRSFGWRPWRCRWWRRKHRFRSDTSERAELIGPGSRERGDGLRAFCPSEEQHRPCALVEVQGIQSELYCQGGGIGSDGDSQPAHGWGSKRCWTGPPSSPFEVHELKIFSGVWVSGDPKHLQRRTKGRLSHRLHPEIWSHLSRRGVRLMKRWGEKKKDNKEKRKMVDRRQKWAPSPLLLVPPCLLNSHSHPANRQLAPHTKTLITAN